MVTKKSVVPATPKGSVAIPTDFETLRAAALTASESADTAAAYAREALATFRTLSAEERTIGTRKSVVASLAAYAAYRAGILIEGAKPKDAADGVMTTTEYGVFWALDSDDPEHTASSKASVTTWLRAGEAFVAYGMDPDSRDAYALLGGLAQSTAWNEQRKVLSAAIAAEPDAVLTPDVVEATVAKAKMVVAERKATVAAEKAERTAREKADGVPEKIADRASLMERLVMSLDPSVEEEAAILRDIAERVIASLGAVEAA